MGNGVSGGEGGLAADLTEALTARFTDHHAFLATIHLDQIDAYTRQITAVTDRIETYFTPDPTGDPTQTTTTAPPTAAALADKRAMLTTIPGVSTISAERIIAEIGIDMTAFPTAAHLTSWAGIALGANESAGKVKSTTCRPGNTYLKGALGVAALAASRSKNTFLSPRYKRIASRRGRLRALVAVQRSILTAVWHILTTGNPYRELGGDYLVFTRFGGQWFRLRCLVRLFDRALNILGLSRPVSSSESWSVAVSCCSSRIRRTTGRSVRRAQATAACG